MMDAAESLGLSEEITALRTKVNQGNYFISKRFKSIKLILFSATSNPEVFLSNAFDDTLLKEAKENMLK